MEVARAFFDACETGKGWEVCQQFCTPDAGFSAQAEPLDDVHTLERYTDWMKGLLTILSDAVSAEVVRGGREAGQRNGLRRVSRHPYR